MVWTAAASLTTDRALRYNAEWYGDKTYVEDGRDSLSYGDFDRKVSQVALALRDRGLEPGDRVLVMLANSAEHVAITYGIHRARCVYVSCSTEYPRDEIQYQLFHSGASAAIVESANADLLDSIVTESGRQISVLVAGKGMTQPAKGCTDYFDFSDIFDNVDWKWSGEDPRPDDFANIIYTSGTTSRPKGVIWTHSQIYLGASRGRDALAYQHHDRLLHFFPLYHSNGGGALLHPILLVGGTLVMIPRFSASHFAETLTHKNITITALNATHVKMLMAQEASTYDQAHATTRAQFGLQLEPERRISFQERFGIRLVEIYGMTETAGIATASPVWSNHSNESAGPPLPGLEVRLVDENGDDVGVGTEGEIVMRSHSEPLCSGYYNDEKSTQEVFRDGWLYSGDVAYFDEDGYLHFVDRRKDMIKRSGYNVAAAEVERVLLENPAVAAAAVVGIEDPVREEAIVGFVVAESGHTIDVDRLMEFCAERLARYKRPQFLAPVENIPENVLGKTEKTLLREWAHDMFSSDQSLHNG